MRGRKSRHVSSFVTRNLVGSGSSYAAPTATSDGCFGCTESLRLACMHEYTEERLDHILILPHVDSCSFCGARRFPFEPPTFCCDRGKIRLAPPMVPTGLLNLFMNPSCPKAILFRRKIRLYNSIFAFTSFGVKVDKELASLSGGVYTFRASGQVFHALPPLVPNDERPKFFQLYFWDSDNELRNRMASVIDADLDEETMVLLMDMMKDNPYAQLLRRINTFPCIKDIRLHISKNVTVDQSCYNCPTADDVAAIWVEGNGRDDIPYDREIVVRGDDGQAHKIQYYFGCYDPLQYPLFFPCGDIGWQQHIPKFKRVTSGGLSNSDVLAINDFSSFDRIVACESHCVRGKNDRMVSCREYYCYRLQIRENAVSILLYGGRLLQQYIVDMYIKLETTRLDYYRRNQSEFRSEIYEGVVDSVANGATHGNEIGHRIVLPSSFIGGPRDMRRRYLDAMALVRTFGKPDLFITITCNPEWAEIKDNLFDGQSAHDRPDLVSRVFRAKLMDLKDQVLKKCVFGPVAAYVYVIEFQKRGLPHCHMLIILGAGYRITSPDMFDSFVVAEIPDKDDFPRLFSLVSKHMMHGPCGTLNRKCPCMVNGRCRSNYPRSHSNCTMQSANGYPIYMRRDNGRTVDVRNHRLNSQWVVPYNPYLLYRYDCHINVEVCSGFTAVKYLYKYIYKGHDKVSVYVAPHDSESFVDEIRSFQDARWVSAPESMWRIFEFDLNEISPPVINLPLHLPNKHCVTFWNNQNLRSILDSNYVGKTMLTEFFLVCSTDITAKQHLYSEFPQYFVWDRKLRVWNRRKQGRVIGRINGANPIEGERYYLRLMLLHVRGPESYDDLLSVHGMMCSTFKEAAQRRGLLECDQSNYTCLTEAATFQMPYALRRLFATILVHCEPSDVRRLWDDFYVNLSEDFQRENILDDLEVRCETLRSIHCFLESMGKNIEMYDLPKNPMNSTRSHVSVPKDMLDELSIPISEADLHAHNILNASQKVAYDAIIASIEGGSGGLFFINGPGGTGKTFLYRALLATIRSRNMIALATATSGVAASILPGGRTAHSRFKIPIELHGNSYCSIPKQSKLAELLRQAKLVVWDEAPMCKRIAIKAVDRTLQDIVGNTAPFGGKVVVLGGDFMQVLPVIVKATIQETIDGSLIRSYLYPCLKVMVLSENMRAKIDPAFCAFLLRVGRGLEPSDADGNIQLPRQMVLSYSSNDIDLSERRLIDFVYADLQGNYLSAMYMTERAILATKNVYVDTLNDRIISYFPGEPTTYLSFDEALDDMQNSYPEEFLNTLTPNGLPPHRLVLKRHCPVMLLRNLDPSDGLCNGTRMVCREFRDNVIYAEISFGHHAGKIVMIPRIPLSPPENEGYPFQFRRKQFPIRLCFAMTINKSQGQTIRRVGIYLPEPVFSHGQLYVALSRGVSMDNTKVLIRPDTVNGGDDTRTKNVVYREVLSEIF